MHTVALEGDTFHLIAKYTPLKLIAPPPKYKPARHANSLTVLGAPSTGASSFEIDQSSARVTILVV
jgi:hypothetical protein